MEIELNKNFAWKLLVMLETKLIWDKHCFLFCNEIVDKSDDPPYWIIELAVFKDIRNTIKIINEYLRSEPLEPYPDNLSNFYIGCLFIRYQRGEIIWATFLEKSGEYADGRESVKEDCEYFYYMLNALESSIFSLKLEKIQSKEISKLFVGEINEADKYNIFFNQYFDKT